MNDIPLRDRLLPPGEVETPMTFWDRHRLSLLLIITICVALMLTVVSVTIYNISGAAQLDLSRPGYQSVSDQVDRDNKIEQYSAYGPINADTVREFMVLYDKQADKAKAVDAFGGNPLNAEVLWSESATAGSE